MVPKKRAATISSSRAQPAAGEQPSTGEQRCTWSTVALTGATLASALLVTADSSSVYDGASLPQVLLILLTAVVASFSAIPVWSFGPGWRMRAWLLMGVIAFLLLSTTCATWLANGRAAWNGFWHVLALVLFGLMVRGLCSRLALARALTLWLFMSAIALSVHGIHQVTISLPESRAEYERDPEATLAEMELDAPPGSALRAQYEQRLNSSEPLATFALTNSLAVVLSSALVALGVWLANRLRQPHLQLASLLVAFLAWLVIAGVCLLTKSRTAYLSIGMVAGSLLLVWWRRQNRSTHDSFDKRHSPLWFATAALAAVGGFVAMVVLLSRDILILREAPKSVLYRLEYWQATSKMILDYAFTGVGLGNFQSYYPRYKLAAASEIIADPHNWLFDIAATCSLPVLALVLTTLAMIVFRSWSSLRSSDPRVSLEETTSDDRHLVRAFWVGAASGWMLTIVLQLLMHEPVDLEATALGLIAGLIGIAGISRNMLPTSRTVRSAALAAFATMMICLLATGSWQASGLALPLVVWLVMSLPSGAMESQQTILMLPPSKARVAVRGIVLMLLVAFVLQTWRPVNVSWALAQSAMAAQNRGDHQTALESAAHSIEADPIDPIRRRLLVQLLAIEADRESSLHATAGSALNVILERTKPAIEELLRCDPAPAENWKFAAETLITLAAAFEASASSTIVPKQASMTDAGKMPALQISMATETTELLREADNYLRSAIDRYPSSVALRAQRAVVLRLLGALADSRRELEQAFSLSEASPHQDRKLAMQQVWLPPALARLFEPAIVRPGTNTMWVQAEPLLLFLRKN